MSALQTADRSPTAAHEHDIAALRRSTAIRLGLAVLYAGVFTAVVAVALWGPLKIKTDVIGYPVFANFNPYNYSRTYYLVVGLFPALTLLIFLALTRAGPRFGLAKPPSRGRLRPVIPAAQAPSEPRERALPGAGAKHHLISAGRVAFVGAVLGLEVGIVSEHLWLSIALVLVGYLGAVALVSVGLARARLEEATFTERVATVNALGAALCVVGLVLVSARTQLRILSPGAVRHYVWFPWWLGLPLAALLFGCILAALRRGRLGAAAIERRTVLLIAGPIALFLLYAYLQGDIGQLNLFEEGQLLAETRLVGAGWVPWRDVVLTHGLLVDVFQTAGGFAVFDNSYWGALAGGALLFQPLYILTTYFLFAYLVGRNWPLVVAGGLIFLGTWLGPADPRFLLLPVVLLALVALLKRATRLRAGALGFLTVTAAILTPEAAAVVPAVTLVLAAYEWYWRPADSSFAQAFRRTLGYAAGGLATVAAFVIYAASQGALGDAIYVTVNLITGHTLDGALPPTANLGPSAAFYFIALAPPVALLTAFAYVVTRLRLRRPFLTADWPMAAVAIYVLFSYSEFLARMDAGHAYLVFMPATPLLLYIVYRIVTELERSVFRRWAGLRRTWIPSHPIGLVLLVCTVAFFWGPIHSRIQRAPAAYHPTVARVAAYARVGYAAQFDSTGFVDLRRIITAYLGPHDRLLDLTDEPALFYYLINRDPSSRWYVPNGIVATAELQRDMLRELRRHPPKLVVLDDSNLKMVGAAVFDRVPATVRLYLVTRWILSRYRPLVVSHGRTIYERLDMPPLSSLDLHLRRRPFTTGVPFGGNECSWGYTPTFLAPPAEPPADPQAVAVRVENRPGGLLGLDVPPGSSWSDYRWVEIDAPASGFGQGTFAISDRSNFGGLGHVISFETLRSSPGRYIIPVSSCLQWGGYGSHRLYLASAPLQSVAGVRLIR